MSDEDELLVLIEAYRNSHSRQHVHRSYHLVVTQFDLDTDLEAQWVFKGLFFRKLDDDTISPCAACCLPPRSRVSAHTFPSLPSCRGTSLLVVTSIYSSSEEKKRPGAIRCVGWPKHARSFLPFLLFK